MTGILHKRPDVVTIMTIQMPNKKEGNRIIRIIRARIQDPRLPTGLARAILARSESFGPGSKIPRIARARPVGNLGSWILDPGPGPNQNDSEMIRMIRGYFGGNPPNMKE